MAKKKRLGYDTAGKVRGFVVDRTTGRPLPGATVRLEAALDGGAAQTVGLLQSDHAGYVSFSLQGLSNARASLSGLAVLVGDERHSIAKKAPLREAGPDFVATIDAGDVIEGRTAGTPSLSHPDDLDRATSPGSFATPPTGMLGDEDCTHLIPGGLASFEHGLYRVVRTGGDEHSGPARARADSRSRDSGRSSGRVELSTDLDALEDDLTPALGVGLVLRYVQRWEPVGQTLGDIVYSLPLEPGASQDIAVVEWSRSDAVTRTDEVRAAEALTHTQTRDRSIEEAVNGSLHEHQEGWSFMAGTAGAASANIPINAVNLSMSADHALGVGIASSTGDRNLAAFSQQDLADSVAQSTALLRSQRSTVVVQVDQAERNVLSTRTVNNFNRCHTLTVQYYEVLRLYRVTTSFLGADPVLLVPHELVQFDAKTVLRWRNAIERRLLDPALASCYEALAHVERCPTTAYGEEDDGEEEAPPAPPSPAPDPAAATAISSISVSLETGARETWGAIWVYLVNEDGTRVCAAFKESVKGLILTDDQLDRHLARNSTRTWTSTANNGPITAVGADVTKVEQVQVEWVEANGNDAWDFSGISISVTTGSGANLPVRVNGLGRFSASPYIRRFDDSGATHLQWNAPAEASAPVPSAPASPTTTPAEAAAEEEHDARDQHSDECCAAQLVGHIRDNAAYYSRVVWVGMDPTERRMRLAAALGMVAGRIDDIPLAVSGNQVAFRMDRSALDNRDLERLIGETSPTVRWASLPTRGVFAEAELGHCNACERRDVTREHDWMPPRPPAIEGISPGPRGTTIDAQPTALTAPVVQVMQAPNAPDPTGMAAALTLLGKGDSFRDMSKSAEVLQLVDDLAKGAISMTEAQI
ncbi:MAG: carboxypeptidase-like regulatory domain-containing protein, partial [Acidimicrobiales bacterium]